MLRKNVEKRQMMKQLDGIFLAVDEICDRGIILEIEPNDVIDKVSICIYSCSIFNMEQKLFISQVAIRNDDIPLTEQTVAQVFQSAKEQIKWSLLK